MPVNLAQHRRTVGSFNNRIIAPKIIYSLLTCRFFHKLNRNIILLVITLLCSVTLILSLSSTLLNSPYTKIKTIHWSVLITFLIFIVIMFIQFIWVHALLIRQSGDIEMSPGPKPNPCLSFSICHWNLNTLTAHDYLRVSLLRAYVTIKKFNVCLSETYLNLSNRCLSDDNDNFYLPGYNSVRAEHLSNVEKGGVCICFKSSLSLKVLDIQFLQECINFEIKIADKICNFISLYRSPSQSKDEFESFADNL